MTSNFELELANMWKALSERADAIDKESEEMGILKIEVPNET
jgi:hypothetical protein